MDGLPHEQAVQEEPVYLLQVFFGVGDSCVAHQPAMLSGKHVDVYLLDLLLLVEVGHDSLRAQPDRLVGVDVPANNWVLDLHLLRSLHLMRQRLPMRLLNPSFLLMVPRSPQSWIGLVRGSEHVLS